MTKFTDDLWRDLVREHGPAIAHAERPEPDRAGGAGVFRRPRVLAGGTLGLAGIGAALVLALGGTAATTPAFAVTREADGTVLVTVNTDEDSQPWVLGADKKLASMGIREEIDIATAPGAATVSGPVSCTSTAGPGVVNGKNVAGTPSGPPVKVLLGKDGTDVAKGNSGPGPGPRFVTVHLTSCIYYPYGPGTQEGNSGVAFLNQ